MLIAKTEAEQIVDGFAGNFPRAVEQAGDVQRAPGRHVAGERVAR